jgi:REP element-mobilizing transposase RayT
MEFLLKFARDRQAWLDWLFEARRRFGIVVLNYAATSNHIHLLVYDHDGGEIIPESIQLSAGRIAREYNRRKRRKGAFREDRYHATAIQIDRHLVQCIVYMDLNMVGAGVAKHPSRWRHCGYREIQDAPEDYRLIERNPSIQLVGVGDSDQLSLCHRKWVEDALKIEESVRENRWSESIAVGDLSFVEKVKVELGGKASGRKIVSGAESHELREHQVSYNDRFDLENAPLSPENRLYWNVYDETSI